MVLQVGSRPVVADSSGTTSWSFATTLLAPDMVLDMAAQQQQQNAHLLRYDLHQST
jgi:hypothetical protein